MEGCPNYKTEASGTSEILMLTLTYVKEVVKAEFLDMNNKRYSKLVTIMQIEYFPRLT